MQNTTQTIVLLSAIIIIVISVMLSVFFVIKRRKEAKNTLVSNGKIGDFIDKQAIKFELDNNTYQYTYFPASNKSPPYLEIETTCNTNGSFRIKKETKVERFFKWLNINTELQTGERNFDDKHYIITEDVEFTRTVLFSQAKRQAITSLFQMGFTHVTVNPSNISIVIDPFKLNNNFNKEELLKAASHLSVLSSHLPANSAISKDKNFKYFIPSHRNHPFKGPWTTSRISFYIIPFLLQIIGAIFLGLGISYYPPLDPLDLFLHSLQYSIPLLILFTWLSIRYLSGRANSHIDVMIIFAFSLFAIPLTTTATILYFNGHLDNSNAITHLQMIKDKRYKSNKNGKQYYVLINSWRKNTATEEIRVNYQSWNQAIRNKTRLKILTQKGHYNYEWIVRYSLDQ